MLYLNLKEVPRRVIRRPRVRWQLMLAFALIAFGALSLRGHRFEQSARPLSIEERESVVSLIEPIDVRLPQLHEWTQGFYTAFNDGKLNVRLDRSLGRDTLARVDGNTVSFSPAFFNTDSMTQEQWLVQIMATASAKLEPGAPNAAQLAIKPSEPSTVTGTE